MGSTLGVDVDSTIWDFGSAVHDELYKICGVKVTDDEFIQWGHWFTVAEREDVYSAFDAVFDPATIGERELYPNVAWAIEELYANGVDVRFITHNFRPGRMYVPIYHWLSDRLAVPFTLTVLKDDKLPVLERVGAFGMIDDRPDFIERVADSGFWAATKIHTWTRPVVERRADVHGFDDWGEVPTLVEDALKELKVCG